MQEEIDRKTIALSVSTAKITGRVLQSAIRAYLNHVKNKSPNVYKGKQSLKKLIEHGAVLQSIDVTEKNIRSFEHVAKKYGIDYALKKDSSREPPKYIVFFKSANIDVINMAFNEYAKQKLPKERQSIRKTLSQLIEKARAAPDLNRSRRKERDLER